MVYNSQWQEMQPRCELYLSYPFFIFTLLTTFSIQNELSVYSNVEAVVGNAITVMQNASMMLVENAINSVPNDSEDSTGNT